MFIIKLFVKDYNNPSNPIVRKRYGIFAGIIGIVTNAVLSIVKIILGLIVMSNAVIADGINNLNDTLSSILTIIGFKISSKPADKDHPFGYKRFEYITGLIISFIILFAGITLFRESLTNLITLIKDHITSLNLEQPIIVYIILGSTLLIKLYQALIYHYIYHKIDSEAIKADMIDSLNDMITTSLTIISTLLFHLSNGSINIDNVVGILISLYIFYSGIMLIKDTIKPLLGSNPTDEEITKIISFIKSYDGVLGVHDLVIHNYGPGINYVTVHVEVSGEENIYKSHDLIDQIEMDFKKQYSYDITIHMDPVLNNEETLKYYELLDNVIKEIDTNITFHDFRVRMDGDDITLLFDIVTPIDYKMTNEELIDKIYNLLKEKNTKIKVDIQIDNIHNRFIGEK